MPDDLHEHPRPAPTPAGLAVPDGRPEVYAVPGAGDDPAGLDHGEGEGSGAPLEVAVDVGPADQPPAPGALDVVASQVESVAAATRALRSLLTDRMTDLSTQLDRSHHSAARDFESYRKIQERTLADIEAALAETEETAGRLERASVRLAATIDSGLGLLTQELRAVAGRLDEAATGGSGSTGAAVLDRLDGLASRIDALGQGPDLGPVMRTVEGAAEELRQLSSGLASRDDSQRILEGVSQIEVLLHRIDERSIAFDEAAGGIVALQAAFEARPDDISPELRALRQSIDDMTLTVAERAEVTGAQVEAAGGKLERLAGEMERTVRSAADATARALSIQDPAGLAALLVRVEEMLGRPPAGDTALARLEHTVARLAQAQADDLERLYEAVEEASAAQRSDDSAATLQRAVARLEAATDRLARRDTPARPVTVDQSPVLDRLEALSSQVDALRRRIALRARPEPAQLGDAAIAAIADAVADRLVIQWQAVESLPPDPDG